MDPGAGKRAKQKEMLQDGARIPQDGLPLARFSKGIRGSDDTTDVFGLAKAGRIVSFVKLYPNYLQIVGSGVQIKVFTAAPKPITPALYCSLERLDLC